MVGRRVPQRIEKATASMGVPPAFGMQALRIAAHVEVVTPHFVRDRLRMWRPGDVGLPCIGKFELRALSAIGTWDQQHGCVPSVSDGRGGRLVDEISLL